MCDAVACRRTTRWWAGSLRSRSTSTRAPTPPPGCRPSSSFSTYSLTPGRRSLWRCNCTGPTATLLGCSLCGICLFLYTTSNLRFYLSIDRPTPSQYLTQHHRLASLALQVPVILNIYLSFVFPTYYPPWKLRDQVDFSFLVRRGIIPQVLYQGFSQTTALHEI